MRRLVLVALASLALIAPAAADGRTAAARYRYDVPVAPTSPWPSMRRDARNTAQSPIRAAYRRGVRPWAFATGKGIFSTPVLGGDGTVYVGSADRSFYAIGPTGRPRWRFRTGGIIDAAATLGPYDRRLRSATVTFGSGDERLYRLRTDRRRLTERRRVVWRFRPTLRPATGQLVSWWEGNPVIGPAGVVYAGNTGGGAYAIDPNGRQRWVYPTGNSVWTAPAFGADGTTYWGSVDFSVHAVDRDGHRRWRLFTGGFVTSSPALGRDGTLYVGSFDGRLYALDSRTGTVRFTFATRAHIYASPALAEDARGTRAIYIASSDGTVYALSPSGRLLWRYDTGDPVRGSPVLGRAPSGTGQILYVGSGNGILYALDATTGRRRWSFDTTPRDPELRDRNDLNGSPALGRRGVYVGGEHGRLWFVPYDYCLHARDRRCDTSPGEAFAADLVRVFPVTPGGSTRLAGGTAVVPPATIVQGRLVVRRGGATLEAGMLDAPSARALVTTSPRFDLTAQLSGDGHHIHIAPQGFLRPATAYHVRLAGRYRAGSGGGPFSDTFSFRTMREARSLPLRTARRRVSALELTRLAVPLPPLLPSLNQIGFDSYDWIAGTVARRGGRVLLWVTGARRDRRGVLVADPRGGFGFPLYGRYRGNSLILTAHDVKLTFSFGAVPLHRFELRGLLGRDLRMRGPSLYSEVSCGAVPVYGPVLIAIGLCNRDKVLVATGTYLSRRYDPRGTANRRPPGLRVSRLALTRPRATRAGAVVARLRLRAGARYRATRHAGAILLTNAATGAPVALDYYGSTRTAADRRGDLRRIRLTIPPGTALPRRLRAYVIVDAFPLTERRL